MIGERQVVDDNETERDQSGYIDLYRGEPFTGLIVEALPSGEIVWVGETVAGRRHGYSVDCRSGHPIDVDEYVDGIRHGLQATWQAGHLQSASRCQHGVEDQRLRADGSVEEVPGAAARIARIRERWQTPSPLTTAVPELLLRFNARWAALLQEARRGLGLA